MSHHSAVTRQIRDKLSKTPRKKQPWDSTTKKALWERVQELEVRMEAAASAAQYCATAAHDYCSSYANVYNDATPGDREIRREVVRRLALVRDMAYVARDKARGTGGKKETT